MSEPIYLTQEQVETLHRIALERHGGREGIRDPNGFAAAVNHPRNIRGYAGGDLFDVAAAYAFHLAQSQAFIDGNKRVAMAAALVSFVLMGSPYVAPLTSCTMR